MSLKDEFAWYLEHQAELVAQYDGRVLVIQAHKVVGDYSSELEAMQAQHNQREPGTYLIQRCSPGDSDYTVTYHSRVA